MKHYDDKPDEFYSMYEVEGIATLASDVLRPNIKMVRALEGGGDGAVSFESTEKPGFYLRHQGGKLKLHELAKMPNKRLFKKDASFKVSERNCVFGSVDDEVGAYHISFGAVNFPTFITSVDFGDQLYMDNSV